MIRWLFLLHRYLGIALGALMVMWCVSGVVMMYVSYPKLPDNDRTDHLAPIAWSGCCKISEGVLDDNYSVREFQIEMLAGGPVLYLRGAEKSRLIDLVTGLAINSVSSEKAARVAQAYSLESVAGSPRPLGLINYDQWTVSGEFDSDRPLYHFGLNQPMQTELYVSSTTGQAVQITTAHERFWNWLGAVPHWLYFKELRRKAVLWSQVVIYTSLVGCFLTGIGIYIGVRQLVTQPSGRWSPYGGFNLWHHVAGIVFGVFTLTWVLSGLLSMNPWGWLESGGAQRESADLRGKDISGAQLRGALQAFAGLHPADIVSLKAAPFDGRLYFIARSIGGERRRYNASALVEPLNATDLSRIAAVLSGAQPSAVPELLRAEDRYYFSHHRETHALPVYRMALRNGSHTLYYVDPVSGELVVKIDRAARGYRWLHEGLHRIDFMAALRGRPQWDVLMLLLMSGVTAVCLTGAYLGYRRLVRS
jgi:hypothetical protein